MKRDYNELKKHSVGDFLKKLQDKQCANNQIDRHNQRQDTVKLKKVGGEIFKQHSSGGYVPVKMEYSLDHRHSAELNALNAINVVKVNGKNYAGYLPTISQLYESVRRPQEKAIIEDPKNIINTAPERIFSQNLKSQLIAHKEESIRQYESHAQEYQLERNYELYAYYERIKQQELIEIEWLQLLCRTNQNFFDSQYVKSLGLVFNYGPPDNHDNGSNSSHNANNPNQNQPEPNEEDEEMINELRAQMEQIIKELAEKDNALAEAEKNNSLKDNALAEKDEIIDNLTQNSQEEKAINLELVDKNNDLTNQVKNLTIEVHEVKEKLGLSEEKNVVLQNKFDESQAKVKPLKEKLVDLKHYNKQLEDDKVDLRDTQKDMREVQKMLIEDKKSLISEKKKLEDKGELLSIDKKYFQDLSLEQAIKITELELVHCNNPDHFEIILSGQENY